MPTKWITTKTTTLKDTWIGWSVLNSLQSPILVETADTPDSVILTTLDLDLDLPVGTLELIVFKWGCGMDTKWFPTSDTWLLAPPNWETLWFRASDPVWILQIKNIIKFSLMMSNLRKFVYYLLQTSDWFFSQLQKLPVTRKSVMC